MKTVVQKKRGRPATGWDPLVQVRLPKPLLDRIDRWAGRFEDMDRSTALRCLLGLGLNRSRSKAATVYDPKGFKPHHTKRKSTAPGGGVVQQPSRLGENRSPGVTGSARLVLIKNGACL